MEFNKITRGANRMANEEQTVYEILDAGFLCHVAFQHEGQSMMIPTAYGRKGDLIYLHGSNKNFMLNQIIQGQNVCIGVTHLDGIVLARNLFHSSVNYRSVVLFGKAELVEGEDERIEGLNIICENIVPGRINEVPLGSDKEIKATMVVKFKIDKASAKVREGGPAGDEDLPEVWSGHIPLVQRALEPVFDSKFEKELEMSESVRNYYQENNG